MADNGEFYVPFTLDGKLHISMHDINATFPAVSSYLCMTGSTHSIRATGSSNKSMYTSSTLTSDRNSTATSALALGRSPAKSSPLCRDGECSKETGVN